MSRRAERSARRCREQGQLFRPRSPEDAPRRVARVVPEYTREQLGRFAATEGTAEEIRPFWLDPEERLCPGGCGKVITRQRRSCGRRWCDAVRPTWGRTVGEVVRAALNAYLALHGGGGRVLTTALTCRHEEGWWDIERCGHPADGSKCSGPGGCRVKREIEEEERRRFPARRRAALNMARTEAVRKLRRAGYPADREALRTLTVLISVTEDQTRGLPHEHVCCWSYDPGLRSRSRKRSSMLYLGRRGITVSGSPIATGSRSPSRESTRRLAFTDTSRSWRGTWRRTQAALSSCSSITVSACSTSLRGSRGSQA